jgi:hypothetical protein
MPHESNPPAELKEWVDRLAPVADAARDKLGAVNERTIAERSGCSRDADGNLGLQLFGQKLTISSGGFVVRKADSGEPASSFATSLVLTYLAFADGTPPSGRWIGFRDLPDGLFYAAAFQAYSGDRLVQELGGGADRFRSAAEALGGESLELGDAAYAFRVLPRIRLAAAYWPGDDELGAQARVLFEDTSPHYMPTDGLAILGSQLVARVLTIQKL